MKCPACKSVCSELRDICPKCYVDMRPYKKTAGLTITNATASTEELVDKAKKKAGPASTSAGPTRTVSSLVKFLTKIVPPETKDSSTPEAGKKNTSSSLAAINDALAQCNPQVVASMDKLTQVSSILSEVEKSKQPAPSVSSETVQVFSAVSQSTQQQETEIAFNSPENANDQENVSEEKAPLEPETLESKPIALEFSTQPFTQIIEEPELPISYTPEPEVDIKVEEQKLLGSERKLDTLLISEKTADFSAPVVIPEGATNLPEPIRAKEITREEKPKTEIILPEVIHLPAAEEPTSSSVEVASVEIKTEEVVTPQVSAPIEAAPVAFVAAEFSNEVAPLPEPAPLKPATSAAIAEPVVAQKNSETLAVEPLATAEVAAQLQAPISATIEEAQADISEAPQIAAPEIQVQSLQMATEPQAPAELLAEASATEFSIDVPQLQAEISATISATSSIEEIPSLSVQLNEVLSQELSDIPSPEAPQSAEIQFSATETQPAPQEAASALISPESAPRTEEAAKLEEPLPQATEVLVTKETAHSPQEQETEQQSTQAVIEATERDAPASIGEKTAPLSAQVLTEQPQAAATAEPRLVIPEYSQDDKWEIESLFKESTRALGDPSYAQAELSFEQLNHSFNTEDVKLLFDLVEEQISEPESNKKYVKEIIKSSTRKVEAQALAKQLEKVEKIIDGTALSLKDLSLTGKIHAKEDHHDEVVDLPEVSESLRVAAALTDIGILLMLSCVFACTFSFFNSPEFIPAALSENPPPLFEYMDLVGNIAFCFCILVMLYPSLCLLTTNATWGMRIFKFKIVRTNGRMPKIDNILVRGFTLPISIFSLGTTCLFSSTRSLHDSLARTRVVPNFFEYLPEPE